MENIENDSPAWDEYVCEILVVVLVIGLIVLVFFCHKSPEDVLWSDGR